jgi:hypothetical protein
MLEVQSSDLRWLGRRIIGYLRRCAAESFSFRLERFSNSMLFFRLKRAVAQLVQADFESAHA